MVFQDLLVEFLRSSTYYDFVVYKALALRVLIDLDIMKVVIAYNVNCE